MLWSAVKSSSIRQGESHGRHHGDDEGVVNSLLPDFAAIKKADCNFSSGVLFSST